MKKILWILAGSLTLAARVWALDDITLPANGDFYGSPTAIAARSAAVTAEITAAVLVETTYAKPQTDTNATTSATLKTPRYIGDMLVGSAGSGTGALWVATSVSTNGWLAIKP
jgi:hypothetical protein